MRERFHVSQANGDFDAAPMLETVTLMICGDEDRALGVELTRGTDELVLAWMEGGEPVPGDTRPGGSDGATE